MKLFYTRGIVEDQSIDKQKTVLSTTIFPTFHENNVVNFGPLTKNDLDLEIQ